MTNIKSEFRQLDEKIVLSNSDLNRLKNENAKMEAELSVDKDKIPIHELKKRVSEMSEEVKELNAKLKNLKSSNVKVISKEEKIKVFILREF